MRLVWIALLVLASLTLGAVTTTRGADGTPTPTPRTVRVFCVDKSSSMSSDDQGKTRFQQGHDHIRTLATAPRPSPDDPVIVICFTETATEPSVFTDSSVLLAYLGGLRPDGGTRIAEGLRKAVDRIGPYADAPELSVMLITDGEDNDLQGIEREQKRLNELFRFRQQNHLSNTVFVRTWSSAATRALADPVVRGGVAKLVDLSTSPHVPVEVRATARVTSATWQKLGTSLRVGLGARAEASGAQTPLKSNVELVADRGQGRVKLEADGHERAVEMEVPVDAEELARGGIVRLNLGVNTPGMEPFDDGVYVITARPDKIELPITLPPLEYPLRLTAAVAGAPRWRQLAGDRATVEIELSWDLGGFAPPRPVDCQVKCQGDDLVVRGERVRVGSSRGSSRCTVEGEMTAGASRKVRLDVTVTPDPLQNVQATPVEVELTGPAPLPMRIEPDVGRYRPIVEGKITPITRSLGWTVRLAPTTPVAPELLRDFEVETVTTTNDQHVIGAAVRPFPTGRLTIEVSAPGQAGLWGGQRIDTEVTFRTPPHTSSVTPVPLKFMTVREPWSSVLVTVALAGVLAVGVVKVLIKALQPSVNVDEFSLDPLQGEPEPGLLS